MIVIGFRVEDLEVGDPVASVALVGLRLIYTPPVSDRLNSGPKPDNLLERLWELQRYT